MSLRKDWPCVMIDLETIGTVPGSVVIEVAAVMFSPTRRELGPVFVKEVSMRAHDQQGREIDEDTLAWWMDRVKEGIVMPGLHGGQDSLRLVIMDLGEFLRAYLADRGLVWSWGIDFDLGILADAYRDYGIEQPWSYGRQRDARTLCQELQVERQGEIHHRAHADAQQEAEAVMEAIALAREIIAEKELQGGAA